MDLDWLDDFLTLCDSGNFSKAASQRNMTQPAFSRRIRSLEAWFGVDLFDRTEHPVSLTDAGRRFQPLAEEILRRTKEARAIIRAAEEARSSSLTFAATHALALTFFPSWLQSQEFRSSNGGIRIHSDGLEACEVALMEGTVQLLLCHSHPKVPNRLDTSNFQSIVVGNDLLMPVASPNAVGRARYTVFGNGDQELPMLVYSPESGLGRIIRSEAPVLTKSVRVETAYAPATVHKAMALKGQGIAWLPRTLIEDELSNGNLVEAAPPAWHIPLEIRLFRRRKLEVAPVEALWNSLTKVQRLQERLVTSFGSSQVRRMESSN